MAIGFSQVIPAATSLPFEQGGPWLTSNFKGAAAFQWGGTFAAIVLLILNRSGQRSSKLTSLLVFFLFTSFPAVLFKILRGQFGCWVSFILVAANLVSPEEFPVSRFLVFVITPNWLADGLRDTIAGGVFCLIIGLVLVIMEMGGVGVNSNWNCNLQCFVYCVALLFLFYVTALYLGLGELVINLSLA